MTDLLDLDFCHYVDLNRNKQQHQLLYTDLLKRADETQKKISYIETIYSEYSVKLKAPTEVEHLNKSINEILTNSKVSANRLFGQIEQDINI